MIKVGVIGGTGYTGVELLRLLAGHPQVELRVITSRAQAGRPVADLFASLRGHVDAVFSAPDIQALKSCQLVFAATPNGVAMGYARELLAAGVKLIDLAADFRLRDPALWQQWYGVPHGCPELLEQAVYGLPEVHRRAIAGAQLVANPGCYPTAVQLGFLPLLEAGMVDRESLIADAKSGLSGAGRKENVGTLFCEAGDSMKAYGSGGHRHLPEICQGLEQMGPGEVNLVFVPHLVPMIRGIHATLYARLTRPETDVQRLFEQRFADEPFVDVMPAGSHPETRSVRGANTCRLAVHRPRKDMVVVLVVEDNLVKGAAGQAVQNMNIMQGLPETMGLEHAPLMP